MICKIANFLIEFENPTASFEKFLKSYEADGTPDITLSVTSDDLEQLTNAVHLPHTKTQLEALAFYNKLLNWLPTRDALFFHSSLIEVEGEGVAFTALSGTGKSTHTLLWQKLLGDKMRIINGDKPIIRILEDGTPQAFGTPWTGKEGFGENTNAPLRHICFIERSEQNFCEKITPQEALGSIFNQIFIPREPIAATRTLELINRILTSCDIWKIKCNMDIEAAEVAYKTIFGGK